MKYLTGRRVALTALSAFLSATAAMADTATPVLDSGNTAWMITATILVLLMSIPGIALFYGGLVRQKNVLSIIMQTMLIVGVISILWVAIGYTWAFGTGFKSGLVVFSRIHSFLNTQNVRPNRDAGQTFESNFLPSRAFFIKGFQLRRHNAKHFTVVSLKKRVFCNCSEDEFFPENADMPAKASKWPDFEKVQLRT